MAPTQSVLGEGSPSRMPSGLEMEPTSGRRSSITHCGLPAWGSFISLGTRCRTPSVFVRRLATTVGRPGAEESPAAGLEMRREALGYHQVAHASANEMAEGERTMRVIRAVCTSCGANLDIDVDSRQAYCSYCGAKMFLDDEVVHVRHENGEQFGYDFEKGRQRAAREAERALSAKRTQERQRYLEESARETRERDELRRRMLEQRRAVEELRRQEVKRRNQHFLKHWLWAWLWLLYMPFLSIFVIDLLSGHTPGEVSIHGFWGWLAWYVGVLFPLALETCLDARRDDSTTSVKRNLTITLTIVIFLSIACLLANATSGWQNSYGLSFL